MNPLEKLLNARKELLIQAEKLVAEGKVEDFNAKKVEIEELDAQIDETKLAQANLKAMQDKTVATDLSAQSIMVDGGTVVAQTQPQNVLTNEKVYENAWAKKLLNHALSAEETNIFNNVNKMSNEFAHTTINTPSLIPDTVVAGIERLMVEQYPLLDDVRKFNVKGNLTMNKHTAINAGDAAWYTEPVTVVDEENSFAQFTLSGHELAKAVTVSWKMKSMSVAEFIPFIQAEIAERMGVAKANGITRGTGVNQPTGIITALEAESLTPQVVEYSTTEQLTYAKLTSTISKVHSSLLAGSSFYANNHTIWNNLATLVDGNGRPLFIPDLTSGGVGRLLGFTVKTEGSLKDGEILFGNAYKGYIMNTNEPMKLVTEDHAKPRETDYVAYEIVDGKVYETKAFSLLKDTTPVA